MSALNNRISELLRSGISENVSLGKILQEEQTLKETLGLHIASDIQTRFPDTILTGSVGLYLHGIKLKRWGFVGMGYTDIDIISPYYVNLSDVKNIKYECRNIGGKANATTFSYHPQERRIDFWVNPLQRWEYVEMDDFKFKVSPLEDIWMAKLQFGCDEGKYKHIEDLHEAMGKPVKRNELYSQKMRALEEEKLRIARYAECS